MTQVVWPRFFDLNVLTHNFWAQIVWPQICIFQACSLQTQLDTGVQLSGSVAHESTRRCLGLYLEVGGLSIIMGHQEKVRRLGVINMEPGSCHLLLLPFSAPPNLPSPHGCKIKPVVGRTAFNCQT